MTLKNSWVTLAFAALLTLPLTACKDTKTLQENEQLKAKVAELQKDNGQIGNDLDAMTASRDELTKENEALKAQLSACKGKHSGKKPPTHKHHHK
jgi:septal ring factor EnvC (AmiA/AmiB activator)